MDQVTLKRQEIEIESFREQFAIKASEEANFED